ncbi:MAG: KamA family radical SAM protein [Sphingomonadales bacterium]|jgi:EF-P beta-lysylation protein EpmB
MFNPDIPLAASNWQADVRAAPITGDQLLARLGLSPADLPHGLALAPQFPLKVPPHFLGLIRPGDPADPLLRQVLALAEEDWPQPGTSADPLQEAGFADGQGVIRKYGSRALLLAAPACAIHCRYCFRRHMDYGEAALPQSQLDAAIASIAADPQIIEVILSGGDPLMLSDVRLGALLDRLVALPQLASIRIHTRMLTSVPARLTPALLAMAARLAPRLVIVLHSNHAQELDPIASAGLLQLRSAGVTLLNQAVLLAGVNDTLPAQRAHALSLWQAGVLPYYVHLLDAVAGAAHFAVPLPAARLLEQGLRDSLPGFLVPRFVREVPGMAAKTPLWQLPA